MWRHAHTDTAGAQPPPQEDRKSRKKRKCLQRIHDLERKLHSCQERRAALENEMHELNELIAITTAYVHQQRERFSAVVMATERGNLQDLIFDNRMLFSHRLLAGVLGSILRMPAVKRSLAQKQLKSRFIEKICEKI